MPNPLKTPCGASVVFEDLSKSFGERTVLAGIELQIPPGQFVAVVGRSGSGKSTLLRLLCGLEAPTRGSARVIDAAGRDARDQVRVVFQEPRLLPWKSLLANVGIGARGKNDALARQVLASVGLGDRLHDYPGVLSGGQKQRVALARALVHEPCVMLLDEPFGALDALTRIEAQRLVEDLWAERGFTALLVTHDVTEAVLLADRVLLIEDGRIAESFEVAVARPRRRDNAELAKITAKVLDRIFSRTNQAEEPRSGSRERQNPDATIAAVSAGV
ncbi:MAG TPA: ATP-binding cassette domain-containing protein [Polyangiaceae bacterium]|jgi:sulfonate transport system ATP-binding protein|nr:ATP-binding cassette domain-containing protein [Polyangiaceae bacterium]